jgi:hypothetical protein
MFHTHAAAIPTYSSPHSNTIMFHYTQQMDGQTQRKTQIKAKRFSPVLIIVNCWHGCVSVQIRSWSPEQVNL